MNAVNLAVGRLQHEASASTDGYAALKGDAFLDGLHNIARGEPVNA
ncbi:hypothetical protein HMPREF9440_01938, partial [Sutterella parvirubra YIT 11816]